MRQYTNLAIISNLHLIILSKNTGPSEELAKQLSIARSTLFDIILYMQEELRAPIFYNKQNKTYEYEYLPKFFLNDAICLKLSSAMDSENRSNSNDGKNTHDEDEISDIIEDDLMEASELNILYGGTDNEVFYRNSEIGHSDDIVIDDDMDFSDLF